MTSILLYVTHWDSLDLVMPTIHASMCVSETIGWGYFVDNTSHSTIWHWPSIMVSADGSDNKIKQRTYYFNLDLYLTFILGAVVCWFRTYTGACFIINFTSLSLVLTWHSLSKQYAQRRHKQHHCIHLGFLQGHNKISKFSNCTINGGFALWTP